MYIWTSLYVGMERKFHACSLIFSSLLSVREHVSVMFSGFTFYHLSNIRYSHYKQTAVKVNNIGIHNTVFKIIPATE